MLAEVATPAASPCPVPGRVQAVLLELQNRLNAAAATNIGFPATTGFDYSPLAPFFSGYLLNNLGDPFVDGAYPMHTKALEREVVDTLADLFAAPPDDRWGYLCGGATEGTEYALDLARTLHPDGIVYHSAAAHHSVTNAIRRLDMIAVPIAVDAYGEMSYGDLRSQLNYYRTNAAIVIANIGTAVTEAVDDIDAITSILDDRAVRRRWIHADAALSGIPLALMPRKDRPAGIDFAAGADSLVTSGHKFLGAPMPCAAVLVRATHRAAVARAAIYTGSPDATVANSRSGLAALVLWYALRTTDLPTLAHRADQARLLAGYAHDCLQDIGVASHHHPWAFTVSFPTPPAAVTQKWVLGKHGTRSQLICMPGVTRAQIDAFVADLRAALTPTPTTSGLRGLLQRRPVPITPATETGSVARPRPARRTRPGSSS